MTTPLPPALPLSAPIRSTVRKKRVLLVDCSQAQHELRVEVMKKLGMDVDCPANVAAAVHSGEAAPARDSERRLSKRTATPNSLDDLLKEELQ